VAAHSSCCSIPFLGFERAPYCCMSFLQKRPDDFGILLLVAAISCLKDDKGLVIGDSRLALLLYAVPRPCCSHSKVERIHKDCRRFLSFCLLNL